MLAACRPAGSPALLQQLLAAVDAEAASHRQSKDGLGSGPADGVRSSTVAAQAWPPPSVRGGLQRAFVRLAMQVR